MFSCTPPPLFPPHTNPLTLPVGSPAAATRTGGHPVPRVHSASTPSWRRPATRSSIGRSRMRATPSSTNPPLPAAATAAVRGRMAVPALPRKRVPPAEGKTPPHPTTRAVPAAQSSSMSTPKSFSAATM